jgi:(1->4)-alpha-D-glucan 1-alpha-D-glucosylmutase
MSAPPPPEVPTATYRLQFGPSFKLQDAERIVPYLASLGISHLYASPILKARAGSTHGYDITDHNALNPEIGDAEDFEALVLSLHRHSMGLILDFVPNHMGIGRSDNPWWLDVLEWGEASPYATFFDIDWMPPKIELRHKVLVPLLGDHYGLELERGHLELRFELELEGFSVWYHDHRFPVGPRHYSRILGARRDALRQGEHFTAATREVVESLVIDFRALAIGSTSQRAQEQMRERALELKRRLARHVRDDPNVAAYVEECLRYFNGKPDEPASHMALHRLLQLQAYRLAYWRVAGHEINYRRFFDISDLAALRMERRRVFGAVHRLVLDWIAGGRVQGLRIDHVDGLFDPNAYCSALLERVAALSPGGPRPFYLVVEKILAHHERLRDDWPVAGTTGYEFANLVNGLFVDPAGQRRLDRTWRRFADGEADFERILLAAKKHVIENLLAGELNVLAGELDRISELNWKSRDFTLEGLSAALAEIVSCFPVYRTYVTPHSATPDDRRDIDWAVARARRANTAIDPDVFSFSHAALTGDLTRAPGNTYSRSQVFRFAMRFQQYTGPVMAKSMEDTAFYRYCCLASLNEVGGDPRRFGVSPAAFHLANQERQRRWPRAMLATATHDAKRGEDVRTRIDVLSELAEEWTERVRRWRMLNRTKRHEVEGGPAPRARDEYLFYQTLVGTWPAELHGGQFDPTAIDPLRERLEAYMVKAAREAKLITSWARPHPAYEEALAEFVHRSLDVAQQNPFLADLAPFAHRIARLGAVNSLSQTVLKLTSPGVPDHYQGTEFWDLHLLDPDNRTAVDFEARDRTLSELDLIAPFGQPARSNLLSSLLADWPDGRIKMYVARRLLALRRAHPDLFRDGRYLPLTVEGECADCVISFARATKTEALVVAAPRLAARFNGAGAEFPLGHASWGGTVLIPPAEVASLGAGWTDILGGAPQSDLLWLSTEPGSFPVGLLFEFLPVAAIFKKIA